MASSLGTVLKDMGVTIWKQHSPILRSFLKRNEILPIITPPKVTLLLQEYRACYWIVDNNNGSVTFITYSQKMPERSEPISTTLILDNDVNYRANTLNKIKEKLDIEELYKEFCQNDLHHFILYPTPNGEQIRCLYDDGINLRMQDFHITADGRFLVPFGNQYQAMPHYRFIAYMKNERNLSSYFPVVTLDPAARFLAWRNANLCAFKLQDPPTSSSLICKEVSLSTSGSESYSPGESSSFSEEPYSPEEIEALLDLQLVVPKEKALFVEEIEEEMELLSESTLDSFFSNKESTAYEDTCVGTPQKRIAPESLQSSISSSSNKSEDSNIHEDTSVGTSQRMSSPEQSTSFTISPVREKEKENENEDGNITKDFLYNVQTPDRHRNSIERRSEIEEEIDTTGTSRRLGKVQRKLFPERISWSQSQESTTSQPLKQTRQNAFTDNNSSSVIYKNSNGFLSDKKGKKAIEEFATPIQQGPQQKRARTC